MGPAAFEQVTNSQDDLDVIKRFEQKISRAGFERTPLRLFVGVCRQNNYRQKALTVLGPEGFENGETVGRRHHQIEQNQIGLKALAHIEDATCIDIRIKSGVLVFIKN